ncbi:hypothetical protein [Methylosinus sp. LW4]|uniref:hypothetical protein n=1 Tax=Methylosinus sp. LW4 TaxID=136993 RepID=UPI0005BCE66B|nr:hypothetical protein [Methylosinus sp. LW4]
MRVKLLWTFDEAHQAILLWIDLIAAKNYCSSKGTERTLTLTANAEFVEIEFEQPATLSKGGTKFEVVDHVWASGARGRRLFVRYFRGLRQYWLFAPSALDHDLRKFELRRL